MKKFIREVAPAVTDVASSAALSVVGALLSGPGGQVPIGTVALLAGAQPFVTRLAEWVFKTKSPDNLQLELNQAFFRDTIDNLKRLKQKIDAMEKRFKPIEQASISWEEATILIEQFRQQAVGSAVQDRRRFLASGAASTFRPDLTLEEKSRASRALSLLEPSDIAALKSLMLVPKDGYEHWAIGRIFYKLSPVNQLMLRQSGCIAIDQDIVMRQEVAVIPSGKPAKPELTEHLTITPVGRAVHLMVETFEPR